MMTPFEKALFYIAWSKERLASNCVQSVEKIDPIVARERPDYDDSLPIRVLEQRGVRFVVEGGKIVDAVSPKDAEVLKNIPLPDYSVLDQLKYGPIVADMLSFGRGSEYETARKYGLVELGTVVEILDFNGEKESRHGNKWAVRLSEKGRAFVRLKEENKEEEAK